MSQPTSRPLSRSRRVTSPARRAVPALIAVIAFAWAFAWTGGPSGALAEEAAGNAGRGLAVARQWCAGCHVIGRGPQRGATDSAPPFAAIAGRPTLSRDRLRAVLSNPRSHMRIQALTRANIDDVIAYILSLRGRR